MEKQSKLITKHYGDNMYKNILLLLIGTLVFTGCASVPMESPEKSAKLKRFSPPPADKAGLYIYRDSVMGGALKKDVWVNGECVGETAPKIFFYKQVEAGKEHKVSTESEFSPNDLLVFVEAGKNYFIKQYIKMGLFVGGANLELVSEEEGRKDVSSLDMAVMGNCSK